MYCTLSSSSSLVDTTPGRGRRPNATRKTHKQVYKYAWRVVVMMMMMVVVVWGKWCV